MTRVKRILQVVALLLALLAATAGYLALTFDAAGVRSDLARVVLKATGRTLTLGGEVSLSFFPRLGVRLSDVRLSARNDPAAPFAALARARVALAVWPLLSGHFEVEHIELDGLQVLVRRDADGRLNVDDFIATDPAGQAASADPNAAPPRPAGPLPRVAIAGVTLRNGELVFEDGVRQSRASLSGLTLDSGPLGNQGDGKLTLGGQLQVGDAAWSLRAGTAYRLDLDRRTVALTDVEVRAGGRGADGPVDARLSAGSLRVQAGQLRAEAVALAVDGRAATGPLRLHASLPAFTADLAARTWQLPGFTLTLEAAPAKLALTGGPSDGSATAAQGSAAVTLDEGTGHVTWAIERFSPVVARAELRLDRVDLDRYRAATAGNEPAGEAAPRIDLGFLRGPEVRGVAQLGTLTVHGVRAADVRLEFWLHKGRLDLPTLSAKLYDGTVQGRASVDSHGNRLTLAQTLSGVDLRSLLRDLTGKDLIEGRGDVSMDLATAGATVDDLARALAGTAAFRVRDGAIRGIDLGDTLRALRPAFLARQSSEQAAVSDRKTAFSSLSASFRIADGVARNNDLDGRMPLFRLSGHGDIDLGLRRIDYLATATLVNTATGQGGKDLAHLRGVGVPVRLQGPFTHPVYRIEFADLGVATVKEAVRERLQGGAAAPLDRSLKRLFGR